MSFSIHKPLLALAILAVVSVPFILAQQASKPEKELSLVNAQPITSQDGFQDPRWSPDGKQIAYVSENGTFVFSVETGESRQVMPESAGYKFSWRLDGTNLLYRSKDGTTRRLNALNIDTGETSVIAEATDEDLSPPVEVRPGVLFYRTGNFTQTSRKGAAIQSTSEEVYAFHEDEQIFVVRNGIAAQITQGDDDFLAPVLSPDKHFVAYQALKGDKLLIHNLDTGKIITLTGHEPTWSPDSTSIIYSVIGDDGNDIVTSDLFLADITGKTKQLTNTPDRLERHPAWSPDGRRVAFDADKSIYIADIVGGVQ